ncbi:2-amino-4-hydroxy-6-hydroxymethyldihydropteridine diphosphokinase [Alkalihalobacterium alkalinitrilicum]|uniref:2-amino-4-hydroxy-6- hydroxymethyldihydropteridine diphosphokinase n=1 Tax=Alkalihalobacterium alkalinitrilicum TaxID=427920 RepID=UPI000995763F|nr:2-amino-4-hydroxy-6-hydroxymethyldihydropteridine diphosphokinase [Alkalihalobacterium alkalinitrilicum]
MNNLVYIGLGSNIGVREDHLLLGVKELDNEKQITVKRVSSIYETAPVGYLDQQNFLNMVVEVSTSYKPEELLEITQNIESKAKRNTPIRWGPRTLDLDILLYNQENIKVNDLTIPHPRMSERSFVIIPLMEINPKLKLPHEQKTVSEIYRRLTDKEGVIVWRMNNGVGEYGLFGS